MKKRLFVLVLVLVLIPTIAIAGTASEQIKVQKNVATITVNGQEIKGDNFIYDGTTYVPLRAVSEKTDNVFLCYNLYKRSAETKDMTNAIAIHFLTSNGDMSTLKNIKPIAKQLVDDLKTSEELYKNVGGDMYTAYKLVRINADHLYAVVDASISYKVTSNTSNTDTALDNCEEILDECDANNEYINILAVEELNK